MRRKKEDADDDQGRGGDPYLSLAGAVLIQAIRDYRAGDLTARRWLLGEGLLFFEALGVDMDRKYLATWLAKGCPGFGRRINGKQAQALESSRLTRSLQFPGKGAARAILDGPGQQPPTLFV